MARIREVCPVDPGKLDKLLEILQPTKALGSQGQPKRKSNDFDKVGEFWGYIETLSGAELDRASTKMATCSHRIHANWSEELNQIHPTDRLRFGELIFDIGHIENVDFANVKTEIIVSQVVVRNARP